MVARRVCEFHVTQPRTTLLRAQASLGARRACAALAALALSASMLTPALACADELLVGAAVSLRKPLSAIAHAFEARRPGSHVLISVGASSMLAAQARAGAPLEIFVSADPKLVDELERDAWSEARKDIARNRLVVVSARDFALQRPDDLISPQLRRLALPADGVPLGGYAREWLAHRGLLERLSDRTLQTEHARATLAAVRSGNANAAIVYETDARDSAAELNTLAIDREDQPSIVYTAALRAGASVLAREFFVALSTPSARKRFSDAGFGLP